MFAKAYEEASHFTHPVVISVRRFDGRVECSIGTFVVLNADGWIITAAHALNSVQQWAADQHHVQSAAEGGEANPDWITNQSFFWGWQGLAVENFRVQPGADLAVGRLAPWDPAKVSRYPVFKDPAKGLPIGTSLLRLGYPFHNATATFDEAANRFDLAPGTLPVPRFPIEGIYTRNVVVQTAEGASSLFLETSSPGLRGQSGGPIVDREGRVWAIQSSTLHLDLGFSPTVERDGTKIAEHQLLNVGIGAHPETVLAFLRQEGIEVALSPD